MKSIYEKRDKKPAANPVHCGVQKIDNVGKALQFERKAPKSMT